MNNPGLIILLGSGETSPTIRKVYHWLFEQMNAPIQMSILETPAGFEPNSDKVAQQIEDFMKKRLQNFEPAIDIIPARKRGTAYSPDDPDILGPMLDANILMMGPGSPTYTVRQLHNSVAWQTLLARHRLGANLIFASATTIAVSACALPVYEIYKVGEDLHWKPGLDFFGAFGLSLVFIPHWDNSDGGAELDTSHCYIGTGRYDEMVEILPANPTIVGIDERTALIIDPVDGSCRVLGNRNVTVVRAGEEKVFATGTQFALDELGPFRPLAQAQVGIPTEVWERAVTAVAQAQQEADVTLTPSANVLSLLDQRMTARAERDWAAADTLRDEIEALGWQIRDTSKGPELEPM